MCLGHTHALSGAAAGLGLAVLSGLPPGHAAVMCGLTAGAAVLPDIDHPDSSLAWSFGFLTRALAEITGWLCGGHRHGTHSAAAVAVAAGLAWLAVLFRHDLGGRAALVVIVALLAASAMTALRLGGHKRDLAAVAIAVALVVTGTGLALLPAAVAAGCAVHLAGDMLTVEGVPLGLPFTRAHVWLTPRPLRFETGRWPETRVLAPGLIAAAGLAAWAAASR